MNLEERFSLEKKIEGRLQHTWQLINKLLDSSLYTLVS